MNVSKLINYSTNMCVNGQGIMVIWWTMFMNGWKMKNDGWNIAYIFHYTSILM